MSLNGIDISRYQDGIDIGSIQADFIIVKATQGTGFVSPTFKTQAEATLASGKLLGLYHYAGGGGAKAEADFFIKAAKPYLGKTILVLDWEGDQNPNFKDPTYAMEFLEYLYSATGVRPFIYMSKSVCRQYDWSRIAADYPLWVAQYANKNIVNGYSLNPWTDKKGYGAWKSPLIFQYTSTGRLAGYSKNLDLDIAYMDRNAWATWAYVKKTAQVIDITVVAQDVINGVYGTGAERKQKLKDAGFDPAIVQAKVNELLNTQRNLSKYVVISKTGLYLRNTAGRDGRAIGVMPYGTEVTWNGNQKRVGKLVWYQVTWNAAKGWCAAMYLDKVKG